MSSAGESPLVQDNTMSEASLGNLSSAATTLRAVGRFKRGMAKNQPPAVEAEPEDGDKDGKTDAPDHKTKPFMGMSYQKPTTSLVRMNTLQMKDRQLLEAGAVEARDVDSSSRAPGAAANLRSLLEHRHGTCTLGWRRTLDKHNAHRISNLDFFKGLRELGYPSDAKAAWAELNGGRGFVTLADLDTGTAQTLSDFYRAFRERIGYIDQVVESSACLRVDRKAFLERCRPLKGVLSADDTPLDFEIVFRALQAGEGYVTKSDCLWLADYCERKTRTTSESSKLEDDRAEHQEKIAEATRRRTLRDFRDLLQHRYGSVISGWHRLLDKDGDLEIPSETLRGACNQIGFKGSCDDLWEALVGKDAYLLKLEDLEPTAVLALEGFKDKCRKHFGSIANAFRMLVASRKPLVARREFYEWFRELALPGSERRLFDFLDSRCCDVINMVRIDGDAALQVFGQVACEKAQQDLAELQVKSWKTERRTLLERASEKLNSRGLNEAEAFRNSGEVETQEVVAKEKTGPGPRQELVLLFERKFGGPVKAWKAVIDPKGEGKVTKEKFAVSVAAAGYSGNFSSLWADLKLGSGSSVRIKDIAPEAVEACAAFKAKTEYKVTSFHKAFEKASSSKSKSNPSVTADQFHRACKGVGYDGPPEKLFSNLDVGSRGVLTAKSLSWLEEAADEQKALSGMVVKVTERERTARKKKQAALAVPPRKETVTEQSEKITQGRQQRASRIDTERKCHKLLGALTKKFGSLARAWQTALDRDRNVELEFEEFVTGLQASGMLRSDADDAAIDGVEEIFRMLDAADEGLITLADLEKFVKLEPTTTAMLADLCSLCTTRYGSIQRAFEELDPEGTGELGTQVFKQLCQDVKLSNAAHRLLEFLDAESSGSVQLDAIDQQAAEAAMEACKQQQKLRRRRQKRDEKVRGMHMLAEPRHIGSEVGVEAGKQVRNLQPDMKVLDDLKRRLNGRFGTLVRAWKKSVDPPDKRTMGRSDFGKLCKLGRLPENMVDSAWRGLGLQNSTLSLHQFDPGLVEDFREMRGRLIERYGSIVGAFAEVDMDGSYQLDFKRFLDLCYDCQFRRNDRRMFEYLDKLDTGFVAMSEIDEKAVEKVKQARLEEEERRCKRLGSEEADANPAEMGAEDGVENGGQGGKKTEQLEDESAPLPAHRNPARTFRETLVRRFRGVLKAWHAIDHNRLGVLTKAEFVAAIGCTGYAGSPSLLWNALGCRNKKLITIRELDPESFRQMAVFRLRAKRNFGSLQQLFEDDEGQPVVRLSRDDFLDLCKKLRPPKPWGRLFECLDVNDIENVTWEEVRFLEEQWTWRGTKGRPVRRQPDDKDASPGSTRTSSMRRSGGYQGSCPERTVGQGPLFTSMKPRKVGPPMKSASLPELLPRLRPSWNDRHQIVDTDAIKTLQLIHRTTCLMTEEKERIKRRVAQKIRDVPTAQWLEEQGLGDAWGDG